MISSEDKHAPAVLLMEQAVRDKLADGRLGDVELYTEYFDQSRFAGHDYLKPFLEYVRAKYAGRTPDLIIAIVGIRLPWMQGEEVDLFPGVPVVVVGLKAADKYPQVRGPNATCGFGCKDIEGNFNLILRLQPEVRRIVVVDCPGRDRWVSADIKEISQGFADRVEFEFWTNRSIANMQVDLTKLPPDTAVFYAGVARDPEGKAFYSAQGAKMLADKSSVPVYCWLDTHLGGGTVGGLVVSYEQMGKWAAETAERILTCGPVSNATVTLLTNGLPMFDWRALQRYGIREDRLPPGSVIKFREWTAWEKYRWWIIGAVVFICLQTALIVGLAFHRARLREAQAADALLADLSSAFVNVSADKVDGLILASQRRVCEVLGLDMSVLWQWKEATRRHLTPSHLYRPLGGPPVPDQIVGEELFPWNYRQLSAGQTVVVESTDGLPPEAARDQATWRYYGVKSSVAIPLTPGGKELLGALSFHTQRKERAWPEQLVKRLQLIAHIFAGALARARADETLRESEARLNLAADAAALGLWRLNLASGRFWVTGRTRQLFAFPANEEITFERFMSLVHPDDQAFIRQKVRTMVESRQEDQIEYRVVRADGSLRWMLSRGQVRCNAAGEPDALMGTTMDVTERKHAEAELEARLKFETLVADLSSAFVDVPADKVDGLILDAQRLVCEFLDLDLCTLWQWKEGTRRYLTPSHIYRPLGGPPVPELAIAEEMFPWSIRQLSTGKTVVVESTDGLPPEVAQDQATWRHFGIKSTVGIPLTPGGGHLLGVLSFHTQRQERSWPEPLVKRLQLIAQIFANALARARADKTIHESESRLSLAADTAALGLWSLNLATGHFWVTDQTRQLFALPATEEITLERFLSLVHPEDRAFVRNRVGSLVESKQEGRDEFRIIHPDGSVRWMLACGRVHCNVAGASEVLTGVTVDITERKQAEQRMALDAAVINHMSEGVVLVRTADHTILSTNRAFEQLYGYGPGELVGRNIDVLNEVDEGGSSEIAREIGQALQTVGHWRGEVRHRCKDGKKMLTEIGINHFKHPVYGDIGMAIHTDISARRETELEIQRQRAQIAHLSRVTMLGELSGSLAHELNQPLAAILSNAQAAQRFLAHDDVDLAELREILKDIVEADIRAGEVIRRLRLLLKKEEIHLRPLDLNEVVADVLSLVRSDLLNHSVRLTAEFDEQLPPVQGDRVQLQQVLLNLIVNATEAMAQVAQDDRGLTVRTAVVDNAACVSITDRGPGIAAEVLQRLYEPFFTTKATGLGMGLKVSNSIMAAHGGRLTGVNNPDGGATFTVTLPIQDKESA